MGDLSLVVALLRRHPDVGTACAPTDRSAGVDILADHGARTDHGPLPEADQRQHHRPRHRRRRGHRKTRPQQDRRRCDVHPVTDDGVVLDDCEVLTSAARPSRAPVPTWACPRAIEAPLSRANEIASSSPPSTGTDQSAAAVPETATAGHHCAR